MAVHCIYSIRFIIIIIIISLCFTIAGPHHPLLNYSPQEEVQIEEDFVRTSLKRRVLSCWRALVFLSPKRALHY